MRIDYVYMLLVLLLPLIPAYVLFRFLPSSANVEGPFKGLTIKLGGAFAAYFVTVLLSWQVATKFVERYWSENWVVVGHLAFDGSTTNHPSPMQALILVKPPAADIEDSGSLTMQVPIPLVHEGATDIQRLVVAVDGYETVNVPLDPDNKHLGAYGAQDYQVTFDERNHQILIGKPIVLSKAP
jgi:hypothetical protein